MRKALLSVVLTITLAFGAGAAAAATAEQEQAFLDAYKTAFAAKDAGALKALLYTDGAIPMAVEFYGEMMVNEMADGTISSIELRDLTADDQTEAAQIIEMPDGGKAKLAPKPYKKLVIKIDTKTDETTSSSTSEAFVADVDGKIVISLPAPAE